MNLSDYLPAGRADWAPGHEPPLHTSTVIGPGGPTLTAAELRRMHEWVFSSPEPKGPVIICVSRFRVNRTVLRWMGFKSYPFRRMQRRRR